MSKGTNDFAELVWHDVREVTREYHLHDGGRIFFRDVRRIAISPRGTHRLETADGLKHIVRADIWTHISVFSAGDWTF